MAMHPTIAEQLAGASRLLDLAGDDPALPAGSRELLTNAHRLIKQVARSWSSLPDFHRDDNDALIELLSAHRDLLGDPARQRLSEIIATPAGDPQSQARRNVDLRGLLSGLIVSSAVRESSSADVDIRRYLRHRLDVDPS